MLKYIASHTATIGGVLLALGFYLTGHPHEGSLAVLTCLASFGVNLTPAQQQQPPK